MYPLVEALRWMNKTTFLSNITWPFPLGTSYLIKGFRAKCDHAGWHRNVEWVYIECFFLCKAYLAMQLRMPNASSRVELWSQNSSISLGDQLINLGHIKYGRFSYIKRHIFWFIFSAMLLPIIGTINLLNTLFTKHQDILLVNEWTCFPAKVVKWLVYTQRTHQSYSISQKQLVE